MEKTKNEEKRTSSAIHLPDSAGARRAEASRSRIFAEIAVRPHRLENVQVLFSLRTNLLSVLLCLATLLIPGCSNVKATLGAITVTDSSGAKIVSLVVSTSVDATVAVNGDPTGLGVDWSLFCGGSAVSGSTGPACGTITPVHVGSNIAMVYIAPENVPVGNTVTLTATSTSDPSQSVSVTLTILPQPVTIEFAQSYLPPATLGARETAQIAAVVTNDPKALGVKWSVSCQSSSCGSLSAAVTAAGIATSYAAPDKLPPAGAAVHVTITATSIYDGTKSISGTIAIMPIEVTLSPSALKVPFRGNISIVPTVTYDVAGAGVKWLTPSCGTPPRNSEGECGSITPNPTLSAATATYNAPKSIPPGGTVKVTGQSVTDPSKTASLTLTIENPPPISVSVKPAPGMSSLVQAGGQIVLCADVANDYSPGGSGEGATCPGNGAGVTWQCEPAYCNPTSTPGYPLFSTEVTAPRNASPLTLALKAISVADPTKSGSAAVRVVLPISVTLSLPKQITAGVPAAFSATVKNDIAPGGVDWTATGCPGSSSNCGTFTPPHTASGGITKYTAPDAVPWPAKNATVTVTASSTASETVPPLASASGQVSVIPVPYAYFVPFAPSTLPVGNPASSAPTLISVTGATANDLTNAGVDWTVKCPDASAAACGQFLETPERVATITTRDVPATFWPYGKKVHASSGQALVYEPPTTMPAQGTVTLTVTSTAPPYASSTQNISITSDLSSPALTGYVQVGSLPVSGASVQLFVAGDTGYGSASTALLPGNGVTTANDGSFTIPAGYSCASVYSLLYLVATGGTPMGVASPNAQLGLMTALGPCGNLNSSVPLIVNELTTVASAHALAPFMPPMATDFVHIGSSGANYNNGPNPSNATNYNNGLANAFASVNNLVDITAATGTAAAREITPAGNGIPPQAEIDTLADALNTCAATAGGAPGDGSPCDKFFQASNVDLPPGEGPTTGNAPTDIPWAVDEVAQDPGPPTVATTTIISGTPLYDLVAEPSNPSYIPPFSPDLTNCSSPCTVGAPYDWSFSVSFAGGGLNPSGVNSPQSSSMAIDASGDVWIANKHTSSVTEFNNLGAALSPFEGPASDQDGGFTGGGLDSPERIAIDPYGNAWVLNAMRPNSSLSVLDPAGDPIPANPFGISVTPGTSGRYVCPSCAGSPANLGNGLTIDGSGNVWVSQAANPGQTGDSGDVAEYAGYNGATVDGKNLKIGAPLSPAGVGFVNGIDNPNGAIAIDNSGDIWVLNGGNSPTDSLSYSAVPLSAANGRWLDPGHPDQGDTIDPSSGLPNNPPQYLLSSQTFGDTLAIDSAGDLLIPNSMLGAPEISELLAGGSSANFGGIGQPVNPSGPVSIFTPVAIDGAGRLWMMVPPNTNFSPETPASLAEIAPSGAILNLNAGAEGLALPSLPASGPTAIAADASGNVWVLYGSNPSIVTEFIGVSTPVVTPTSVAVLRKKLGSTP